MTPADFTDARHAMGLTQKQLAERLGVTVRAVQYWEAGRRATPLSVQKMIMVRNILAKYGSVQINADNGTATFRTSTEAVNEICDVLEKYKH